MKSCVFNHIKVDRKLWSRHYEKEGRLVSLSPQCIFQRRWLPRQWGKFQWWETGCARAECLSRGLCGKWRFQPKVEPWGLYPKLSSVQSIWRLFQGRPLPWPKVTRLTPLLTSFLVALILLHFVQLDEGSDPLIFSLLSLLLPWKRLCSWQPRGMPDLKAFLILSLRKMSEEWKTHEVILLTISFT